MAHLSESRLFELGLDVAAMPSAVEAAHLADCARCTERLCEERQLTAALVALPCPEPSADFAALATERFVRRQAGRPVERRAAVRLGLMTVLVAGALLLSLLGLTALVMQVDLVVEALAHGLKDLAVLVAVCGTVFFKLPQAIAGIVLMSVAAVGLMGWTLARAA